MIRDEDQFAKKITRHLDTGAAALRAGTAYKLSQARARAMARLDPAYAPQAQLAPAAAGAGSPSAPGSLRRGVWLAFAVLLLAAAIFGYQQWSAYQQTRELAELDLQILTSDLPIDAYVDRGFQTWLTDYQR
jgi:hypothetical protein